MIKQFLVYTLPVVVTLLGGTRYDRPATKPKPATPPPAQPAAEGSIFRTDGTVDREAYVRYTGAWDSETVDRRLGPSFERLSPLAVDDRPTHFRPESKECKLSFANKINPYELGQDGCIRDGDYWSDCGQVGYVPDDLVNDPGLDRIQTFAYYDRVFALSPRLDYASGTPHPDPQTRDGNYKTMLGGTAPKHPIAMVRNYAMLQNEALVLYRGGLLAVAGTQTSRAGNERPYPGLLFPAHKVPTALAVTASNEFAVVTVMDTQTLKGQLAVVALEGKFLPFHTWPYMAFPNQGSWSSLKLLGYIDLPMAAPNAVAASSNGWWQGPSQTDNKVLSQLDLNNAGTRNNLLKGDQVWQMVVATKGYAIVSSKQDNKAVIVDLSALLAYSRDSYLSSEESFKSTVANRGNGPGQWPATFQEKPELTPRVVWQKSLPSPTAVLAGLHLDRWSSDRHKAYVAREDGTIHIIDTSSLMARFSYEKSGALTEMGSFKVGRNPVSMSFARFNASGLPLLPAGKKPDPLNNYFYVACRGDRSIEAVITYDGQGAVHRRITDSRLSDPVAVSVAFRGNILTVADFNGKKIHSFRIGAITSRHNVTYGCGADGKQPYEYTGELALKGKPFLVNSTNLN